MDSSEVANRFMSTANKHGASYAVSGVAAMLAGPVLGGLLGGLFDAILEIPERPSDIYQQIKGLVQIQIDTTLGQTMGASLSAKLEVAEDTLGKALDSYKDAWYSPESSRERVRSEMDRVRTLIESNEGWRYKPQGHSVFTLCSPAGLGFTRCLAWNNNGYLTGEKFTKFDSLSNKRFTIDNQNRLMAITDEGLKCVVFDKDGGLYVKTGWAIIQRDNCDKPQLFRLKVDNITETGVWKIFAQVDGYSKKYDLCVAETGGNQGEVIYYSNIDRFSATYHACINGVKELKMQRKMIFPVSENSDNGVEALSFRELVIQVNKFPRFAALHLLTLKDIYKFNYEDKLLQVTLHEKGLIT